jgi:hypothetical protein
MAILFTGSASGIMYGTGNTASTPLVIIENARGSQRLVTIKRMNLFHDVGAILSTVVKPIFRGFRSSNFNANDGGGDILAKGPFNTTQTSDPFVRIWTGNSTSQGAPSRFTATVGHQMWNIFSDRLGSLVEQYQGGPASLIPSLVASTTKLFKLYPGESYIIYDVATVVANQDGVNNLYMVNVVWTEETLSTYTISGTVTNGGTGVVSTKVVNVIIADDIYLTNAILWAVVDTTSGGAWTCDIPTGKIAYAYAQYYNTGTYYTSPGVPFLS